MGVMQSTTQVFEVTLEPHSEAYEALAEALRDRDVVTLRVSAPWSEPMFVHGDRVQVPFDHGYGPAIVDSASDEFVSVTYGPRQKYRTSLSRGSILTDRRREYPATVEVVEP
jgi:hypothetical protein